MDLSKLAQKIEKLQTVVTLEKEVDVGDLKFTLRPLTTVEEIALHEMANERQDQGINYLTIIKQGSLGFAIHKIDGEVIPDVVEITPGKERLNKHLFIKKKIIEPMSQAAIDTLFNAYLILNIELQKKIQETIKFENSDYIKKYLDQEATAEVAKTVEKTVDKVVEGNKGNKGNEG